MSRRLRPGREQNAWSSLLPARSTAWCLISIFLTHQDLRCWSGYAWTRSPPSRRSSFIPGRIFPPMTNCACGNIPTRSSSKAPTHLRSEEHTSELQSLMHISYAGFLLTQKQHILPHIQQNKVL